MQENRTVHRINIKSANAFSVYCSRKCCRCYFPAGTKSCNTREQRPDSGMLGKLFAYCDSQSSVYHLWH
nr:MAG TPA: hypothetical protein [Caudoviricetes sp.]